MTTGEGGLVGEVQAEEMRPKLETKMSSTESERRQMRPFKKKKKMHRTFSVITGVTGDNLTNNTFAHKCLI